MWKENLEEIRNSISDAIFKVGKNVDRVVAFRNLESVKEFLKELLGTKIEFENKNQKGGKK